MASAGRVGRLEGRLAAMLRNRQWDREDQMDRRAQENHDFNLMRNRRDFEWESEMRPYMIRAMEARTGAAEQNLEDQRYLAGRRRIEDQRADQARTRFSATPEGQRELDARTLGTQYRRPESVESERLSNEGQRIANGARLLNWKNQSIQSDISGKILRGERLSPGEQTFLFLSSGASGRRFGNTAAGAGNTAAGNTAAGRNSVKMTDYIKNYTADTVRSTLSELGYNPDAFDLERLRAGAVDNLQLTGEKPGNYLARTLKAEGHTNAYSQFPEYMKAIRSDAEGKTTKYTKDFFEGSAKGGWLPWNWKVFGGYREGNTNAPNRAKMENLYNNLLAATGGADTPLFRNVAGNENVLRYFERGLNLYRGDARKALDRAFVEEFCDRNNVTKEGRARIYSILSTQDGRRHFSSLANQKGMDQAFRDILM